MKLYVGNLPWGTSENDLRGLFTAYGAVESVTILTDQSTGRSKGLGVVELPSDEQARAAMGGLNGRLVVERSLTVSQAQPRSEVNRYGGLRGRY